MYPVGVLYHSVLYHVSSVIVVCKKYCTRTLAEEMGINNPNSTNSTYIPTADFYEAILRSHNQFLIPVGFEISEEDQIFFSNST